MYAVARSPCLVVEARLACRSNLVARMGGNGLNGAAMRPSVVMGQMTWRRYVAVATLTKTAESAKTAETVKAATKKPAEKTRTAKKDTGAPATAKKSPSASKAKAARAAKEPKPAKEPKVAKTPKATVAPAVQSQKTSAKPSRPSLASEGPVTRPAESPPTPSPAPSPSRSPSPAAPPAAPAAPAVLGEASMEARWRSSASPKPSPAQEKELLAKRKTMALRYMSILVSLPVLIVTSYFLFVDRRKRRIFIQFALASTANMAPPGLGHRQKLPPAEARAVEESSLGKGG
jgi:hypothetical protein